MKRDTDMIARQFPREMDEVEVYPIGDVHLGAQEHMADAWRAFVDSVKAKPNAYLVLLGDLLNNGTRTSVTNIFTETARPADQKRQMAEMLGKSERSIDNALYRIRKKLRSLILSELK